MLIKRRNKIRVEMLLLREVACHPGFDDLREMPEKLRKMRHFCKLEKLEIRMHGIRAVSMSGPRMTSLHKLTCLGMFSGFILRD